MVDLVEIIGLIMDEMFVSIDLCCVVGEYLCCLNGYVLLVVVDGEIVYEWYDNGWDVNIFYWFVSGIKSFVGVVVVFVVE